MDYCKKASEKRMMVWAWALGRLVSWEEDHCTSVWAASAVLLPVYFVVDKMVLEVHNWAWAVWDVLDGARSLAWVVGVCSLV